MQKHSPFLSAVTCKRALGIIIPLCLISLTLGGIVITVANDMYAFVKPEGEYMLTVDKPTTATELSNRLKQNGIIKNSVAFELYLRSRGKADSIEYMRGTWVLDAKMSYREIIAEIF